MRALNLLLVSGFFVLASCSSIKVVSDYAKIDFNKYKTFAFYKKGIDKASVSDLDKKRIMRAIEGELIAKGLLKSENPDLLVSVFTKSRDQVNVTDNNLAWGWGWGWTWRFNPWIYSRPNITVSQYTEGILFIDLIDKTKGELVWQGIGSGVLTMKSPEKREARIKEFVNEIISFYPPDLGNK